jgi:hypothetical protein
MYTFCLTTILSIRGTVFCFLLQLIFFLSLFNLLSFYLFLPIFLWLFIFFPLLLVLFYFLSYFCSVALMLTSSAALWIPYATAYHALYHIGQVAPQGPNVILVHGASGGVGTACLQV